MEIRNFCCSTPSVKTIQLGRPNNLDRPLRVLSTRSRWRSLWKKLMREKRKMKIFDCSTAHAAQVHVPGYDPYSYAQNFDRGLLFDDEPDNLSRSFSMRFAAPARLSNANAVIKRTVSDVGDRDRQDGGLCVVF